MGGFPRFVLFLERKKVKVHTIPTSVVHTLIVVYKLYKAVVLRFAHIHAFLRFSFARSA